MGALHENEMEQFCLKTYVRHNQVNTHQVGEKARLLPPPFSTCLFMTIHKGRKKNPCLGVTDAAAAAAPSLSLFAVDIIPGSALVPVHSSFVVFKLAFASQ